MANTRRETTKSAKGYPPLTIVRMGRRESSASASTKTLRSTPARQQDDLKKVQAIQKCSRAIVTLFEFCALEWPEGADIRDKCVTEKLEDAMYGACILLNDSIRLLEGEIAEGGQHKLSRCVQNSTA
jgi:hypothetical protein